MNDLLDALDRAWRADVVIPAEDTAAERFQWHRTELDQLTALLDLGVSLTALDRDLAAAGLPHPNWTTHFTLGLQLTALMLLWAVDTFIRRTTTTAQLSAPEVR